MRSVIEAATMSIAVCAHARGLRYHCGAARKRARAAPARSLVAEAARGEFKRGTKPAAQRRRRRSAGEISIWSPDKTEPSRPGSEYCGNINPGQS